MFRTTLTMLFFCVLLALPATAAESCRELFDEQAGEAVQATSRAEREGWGERILWWLFGEGKIRFKQQTTEINGIKAYEVDAERSSAENELVRAARLLLAKHGGSVFLQNRFAIHQENIGGFTELVKKDQGEYNPSIVFNKQIAKHPSLWSGTIWHEFVHAGDYDDALKGIDLGRLRTLKLRVQAPGSFKFGIKGYTQEFISGEIHAHVVQAGVNLRDASRAIERGDAGRANKLLSLVAKEKKRVKSFINEADEQLSFARDQLLKNPDSIKITRKGGGNLTVLVVEYEYPYYPLRGMSFAREFLDWLRPLMPPKSSVPIKMVVFIDPGISEAQHGTYLADFLARTQADYHRFDKTFAHLSERAKKLEDELARKSVINH